MATGPSGQINIDDFGDSFGDDDAGSVDQAPSELTGPGGAPDDGAAGQDPGDVVIDPGDISGPEDDDNGGGGEPSPIDRGTGDASRDTQLEQETGVGTGDVAEGEAGRDLTDEPDQEFGPSGGETSGFEDPDRLEGGLGGARFAQEETTVAGETFQEGQALPTDRDIAERVERRAIEDSDGLGEEDIAVRRTRQGFEADLTEEGVRQLERNFEFRQRQARMEARQQRRERQQTLSLAPRRQTAQTTEADLRQAIDAGQEQRRRQAGQQAVFGQMTQVRPGQRQTSTLEGTLADVRESIVGPPGTLESEAGYAVSDPVGAIFGAPGSIESAGGTFAFEVRDRSREAVDVARREVVDPLAPYVGEAAESVIALQPTADIVPGVDIGTQATAEELEGAEDDVIIGNQPETQAGQVAEEFARGSGGAIAESTVGLPAGAVELGALGAESGEFTAREIEERGPVSGGVSAAEAGVEFAGETVQAVQEQAQENPAQFTGAVTGGIVTSLAGGSALESIPIRARARLGSSGDTVDFDETTSPRGAEGELPEYETSPDAPTEQAVREVRERAADQPDTIQESLGDSVLFRSETERLPGDVEAGVGQYELPGLFASPDASPLRLDIGADSSLSSFRPRLPRPFAAPQRLSAFESPDIEGMPSSATGARRIEGPDGDPMPDPTTGGAQFLSREADTGTAYVRPTGSRTTELEAIFPPGSQFVRTTTRRVDIDGGDPATLDVFRRVDTDDTDVDVDVPDDQLISGEEILRRESRSAPPDGQPLTPIVPPTTTPTAAPTTTATPTATTTVSLPQTTPSGGFSPGLSEPLDTTVFDDTSTARVSDGGSTDPALTGRSTTGPTRGPTGPTTTPSQPASDPTQPPRSPPSSPSSRPPSRPPTSPPGIPTFPPSRPPRTPTTPTDQPPRRPRDSDDSERDESGIPGLQAEFASPVFTEFRDPLTGSVLRTEDGDQSLVALFGG